MDRVTEQRLDQPADSREELVTDQGQGSQAQAPTQLLASQHLGQSLATSIGDSDSQRHIRAENNEEAKTFKRRVKDQIYRAKQKDKKWALENENYQLKLEIQEKEKMKFKLEVVEAENARLKCELEEKKQLTNSLLRIIGVANEQQISATNMQPLLAQIKLVAEGFVSLNQKVAELQKNITQPQPPGTQVYAQPRQPQPNILTNQGSQAVGTTLPLTQLAGTSRVQQTFQTQGAFIDDSLGLPDFWPQEQLGQTAQRIGVSPEFSLHQRQGGSTAVESQPFTHQGLLDQEDANLDEFFFSATVGAGQQKMRGGVRILARSKAQTFLWPFTKAYRVPSALLKPEIQEKQEQCQEDQQMKSNVEALEAENNRLKLEIEEKKRQMYLNLRAFFVDYRLFENKVEAKEFVMKEFGYKNGRLEREIEEKERLMNSNMEAFEAENGKLKPEIGEKEQPMKSNLEAFETRNERLKHEIEEKKQLMKSNMKAFEAQNGRLEHEIQAKKQLVKSSLETLEAQTRQLVDEFESLNVTSVSVDLGMKTQSGELAHLEINFDKFKLK